jgi:hypothetical protein
MDRFIIKKCILDDDSKPSVPGTNYGNFTRSTVSVTFESVVPQYKEYYWSYGFILSGGEQPRPKSVCSENLANQAEKTPSHKALTIIRETY